MVAGEPNFSIPEERPDDRLLDLATVLEDLIEDGLVRREDAENLLGAPRSKKQLNMHPLELVAAQELENRVEPGTELELV